MKRVLIILLLGFFSVSSAVGIIKRFRSNSIIVPADFEKAMGKGTHDYEVKFRVGSEAQKKLKILKDLYIKNNPRFVRASNQAKIPRIIHQVWVGENPIPEKYKKLKDTWLKMHPGWQYMLWTNKEAESFPMINRAYYDLATDPIEKANLLRYEVLKKYGGVYVDMDIQCIKPLTPFHNVYDFYTGICPADCRAMLNNALIGCTPNHPILNHCIKTVSQDWNKKHRVERDGVMHFSRSFFKLARSVPGATIALPATYFYPLKRDFDAKAHAHLKDYIKPETYAVHFWAFTHQDLFKKRNCLDCLSIDETASYLLEQLREIM